MPCLAEGALIAVFILFLCLPTLDSILHLDRTPPQQENRNLAKLPKLDGLSKLRPFLAGVEAWVNDHFGFRQRLLRWNNNWKFKVFHECSTVSILLGREGWMYWTADGWIDDYCGLSRFNERQLRDWQALLETRRDWLRRLGSKYIFVIPPNKQSIYPEYIPNWLKKGDTPSKLDQLMAHMKAHSTVEILDLRPPLMEFKKTGFLFLKTDTHWNQLGAFLAYEQLASALSRQIPAIKTLPLEAFTQKAVAERAGDCARFIGQADELQETQQVAFSPISPLPKLQITTAAQHPEKSWPTPNLWISENAEGAGEAVVICDSFGGAWMPFLGYHFKRVIYVGRAEWDRGFLERERPDVVIDEQAERYVVTRDPKKLMQSDLLSASSR